MSPPTRIGVAKASRRIRLNRCPVGLFMFEGTFCVMTEYWTSSSTGSIRDAYIINSGEYFWGGTKNADDRACLLVYHCDIYEVPL